MPTYKTQGIIIKRLNFGEADRILTIFTKEHGKVSAIAKGVRRTLSKLAGDLELFCLSDLMLAEGRNMETVASAQIRESFLNLRSEIPLANLAYYAAELVNQLTAEKEKHSDLFDFLHQFFRQLDSIENPDKLNPLLLPYFQLKLLALLGYKPEVDICLVCHQKLQRGGNQWSSQLGGVVDKHCPAPSGIPTQPIADDTIKIIRLILENDFSIIAQLEKSAIKPDIIKELKEIADDFLTSHLERQLKSERFIK